MANAQCAMPGVWTPEENKRFEVALARHFADPLRFLKIAQDLQSRSPAEVEVKFRLLQEDVMKMELGVFQMPGYGGMEVDEPAAKKQREALAERRKGIPWTAEEHRLFLLGLAKFGKGDWRSISRNFVVSRTPTQVASHAQKYFIRMNSLHKKDKRRSSIHDIEPPTTATAPAPTSTPLPNPTPAAAPPAGISMAPPMVPPMVPAMLAPVPLPNAPLVPMGAPSIATAPMAVPAPCTGPLQMPFPMFNPSLLSPEMLSQSLGLPQPMPPPPLQQAFVAPS